MAQDIRIKFHSDDSELDATKKKMSDLSQEELKVASNAKKMSEAIQKGAKDSKSSANELNSTIKNVGATILAAFTIDKLLSFGNEVIRVRGEFQKLEAVLTNTLGSKSAAQRAMSDLNTFAAQTNFGVVELTNSFVKLANQGFTPSLDQMRNLADLANSTGKGFDQLTEAIIDAQTGEFERLKEFGIRASKSGDNVKFTFKGVETQVKFTNQSIREYIVGLGELNGVQGATEAISKTLVGQVSNLGDSWDQLLNTIGQQSEGVLVGTISLLNEAIQAANELLKTEAQRGEEQAARRRESNEGYVQEMINADLKNKFLKDQDAQYVAAFEDGRNQLVQADFKAFASIQENRVEAAKKTLDYFRIEVEKEIEITRGKTIAESLSIRQKNRDLLAAAQEYYDALTAKRTENEQITQKQLEDEYKKQLALLEEREKLAIREAKVAEMSNVYILDIEKRYNEDRVALFRKFNQQNINELKDYQLRFKENAKETQDAIIANNIKYAQLETKKIDLTGDSNKIINDINMDAMKRNIQAYRDEQEAFKKAQEEKAKAAEKLKDTLVSGMTNIYNQLADRQQAILQNEMGKNEEARKKELEAVRYEADTKKELRLKEINQIKDEEERIKKLREFEERSNQQSKDAQTNVNSRFDALNRQLKRRQAEIDKQQAEFNIIINAAQAVSKTLASGGPFAIPLSVAIGGLALAQLAIIESTELPTFKGGGHTGNGFYRDETGDRVAGVVHENEFVHTKEKTREFRPLFEAIHRGEITERDIIIKGNDSPSIDYGMMTNAYKQALKGRPEAHVYMDERGFSVYMHEENKKTMLRNKRYSSK